MIRPRIIPSVLIKDESVIKTVRFKNSSYIGDPCNTIKIFNELEVDELLITDISLSRVVNGPNFELVREIAEECFMPVCYSGGVRSQEDVERLLRIGVEKVAVNTAALKNPGLITDISAAFGSQSLVVSIDFKRRHNTRRTVYNNNISGITLEPTEWAQMVEELGAGEILLTSVDHEGTWSGCDIEIVKSVSAAVGVPVVAQGGVGSLCDIESALMEGGASAVAVGSMFMFQKKGYGVLVNYPDKERIEAWMRNLRA